MNARGNTNRGRGCGHFNHPTYIPGGNYRSSDPARPITEGLSDRAIGAFDNRTLRFVEATGRAVTLESQLTLPAHDIVITSMRCIGSFNWVNAETPTILVPGSPPIWENRKMPFKLKPDSEVFADGPARPNIGPATGPKDELRALFAAVDELSEEAPVQWPAMDFILDRNSLRQLLRWVEQPPTILDFRVDLHLAGDNTVVMTRWKVDRHVTWLPGSFGFSYQRKETSRAPGCEDTRSEHRRIVTYDFDRLRFVVLFEVNARLPAESTTQPAVDDLAEALRDVHIQAKISSPPWPVVRRVGELVPQEDLIELKTRSEITAPRIAWSDVYVQLFFSQTRHHVLAIHKKGTFNRVRREELDRSESLRRAAAEAQPGLKRLRVLLAAIQQLVILHGCQKNLSLVQRDGVLEVFERQEGVVLPDEIVSRFTTH